MKGKFRILRRIGLGVFLVCALMVALMPVAPVSAASEVTDVCVDFPYEDAKNTYSGTANTYIVHFKPTTALLRGVDYVTVTFPDGSEAMGGNGVIGGDYAFTIGSAPAASTIDFSTDYDTTDLVEGVHWYDVTITPTVGGRRMKVLSPIDIAAGQDVWVRFVCSTAITAAATEASAYRVYVSTTKDTTPRLSSTFALGDSTPEAGGTNVPSGFPLPATAESTATWVIMFSPTTSLTASTGKVTVKFPIQATVPSSLEITDVGFGTSSTSFTSTPEAPVVNTTTREVTAITSITMTGNAGSNDYYMQIKGITNPTIAESASNASYKVMVRTSEDGKWECSAGVAITASALNKVIVANGEIGNPTSIWSDDATMVDMYSSQIYLALGDQYGNAKAPGSAVTVTLSSSSSTGAFYWDDAETTMAETVSSCTSVAVLVQDPNAGNGETGEGDQIVYYKDSTAGTHTLTFSATNYTNAEWTFTVCPGVSVYDSADNLVSTYKPLSTSPTAEVGDGSPYTQKYSVDYINDAITGAMTGDTVKLGDGIYELDTLITVDEAITFTSVNGASSTTLRGTVDSLDEAMWVFAHGTAANPIIIDGLTFERWRYGKEIRECIESNGWNYVTVRNCVFNDIMPDELMDDKDGVISLFAGGGRGNVDSMVISNNTFNNCCTYPWPKLSTEVWELTAVINVQAKDGSTLNGLSITGNTLTNCDGYDISVKGTAAALHTGSITNNTLTDCYWAICIGDHWSTDGFSITGNTITGAYEYGIEIEGDALGDLTIKNNTITGSALVRTNSAIHLAGETASGGYTYYVQYNDIYDNASGTDAIEIGTTSAVVITDINCNYNYYGDASGPYYSALTGATVTKSNPNGTGASISDAVFYYPWLHKPVTDVVADNVSWQSSVMKLVAGWNTLSTPVPLIAAADTIDELIPSGMSVGYYYDGGWTQITAGYTLSPCDAVYVKMDEAKYVQLKFECETFSTPSKDLAVGWNLCSLAALASSGKQSDLSVASVYKTPANLPGYAQVISPSLNANRCDMYYNAGGGWTYSSGETWTAGTMYAGLGYWIYMVNAATLVGFEITPIAPDLD